MIERSCGRGISDSKEHVMMSENSDDEGEEKIEKKQPNSISSPIFLHLHPMCG